MTENPDLMGNADPDDAVVWKRDDATRVVTYGDGTTRPYDADENAAADKRVMKSDLNAILADLQSHADKAQQIIDTPNATINASPAGYIKDLARGLKRTIGSVKDLVRMMK